MTTNFYDTYTYKINNNDIINMFNNDNFKLDMVNHKQKMLESLKNTFLQSFDQDKSIKYWEDIIKILKQHDPHFNPDELFIKLCKFIKYSSPDTFENTYEILHIMNKIKILFKYGITIQYYGTFWNGLKKMNMDFKNKVILEMIKYSQYKKQLYTHIIYELHPYITYEIYKTMLDDDSNLIQYMISPIHNIITNSIESINDINNAVEIIKLLINRGLPNVLQIYYKDNCIISELDHIYKIIYNKSYLKTYSIKADQTHNDRKIYKHIARDLARYIIFHITTVEFNKIYYNKTLLGDNPYLWYLFTCRALGMQHICY